ncbi:hypothetical protein JL2886_00077 [Phaeobacter gallaeciensis]|uniref:Uncharacterized protein n=1 Tax=Phaeobacter gallaeciensis TaxID=60890 RepID=A0A1B0ZLH6_9RHOB|nr:hypothetical protein JL2886_00077 [Phaeobacter gallaeciensis]
MADSIKEKFTGGFEMIEKKKGRGTGPGRQVVPVPGDQGRQNGRVAS